MKAFISVFTSFRTLLPQARLMDQTALLAAYSTLAFSQGGAGVMFDVTVIHSEKEKLANGLGKA